MYLLIKTPFLYGRPCFYKQLVPSERLNYSSVIIKVCRGGNVL